MAQVANIRGFSPLPPLKLTPTVEVGIVSDEEPSIGRESVNGTDLPPGPLKATNELLHDDNKPLGTARHIRIITIGAGASGINAIRAIRKHLTDFELVVYEKNPSVGGTWHENRYPGCKCDIPSHNYQFSWRPNPDWSAFYSPATEILDYIKTIYNEENMWNVIKLSHQVVHAQWDEGRGMWLIKIKNLETGEIIEDECHFLLDGSGVLNNWKWPSVKGLESFKGELVHSANWPRDFQYEGKTVAVIGNGSSGIQIVPAIQRDVKRLVHFVRSPSWIVPPLIDRLMPQFRHQKIQEPEMEGGYFTERQRKIFRENPEVYDQFIKATEEIVNAKFKILVNGSEEAAAIKKVIAEYMSKKLSGNQRLIDAMVPDFPVGCRRITPEVHYLNSLQESNVKVITDAIAEITSEGIMTAGGEHIVLDAIICATGFDVGFIPRFPLIGRNGNLQDIWKNRHPQAYMSLAVPNMPNYFMFLGPNGPIGHGSVLTLTEHASKYIVKMIRKCQTQGIKAVAPREDVVRAFYEHTLRFMPRTAWAGNCRSWFKNDTETGSVTALHPGSRIHWFHMVEQFRTEDFEYEYICENMFDYLGNGFSTRELNGNNQTWYLDEPDVLF